MAEPRKPQPTYADTKRGHRQLLEDSGLVPKYIKKKVEEDEASRGRPAMGPGIDSRAGERFWMKKCYPYVGFDI